MLVMEGKIKVRGWGMEDNAEFGMLIAESF